MGAVHWEGSNIQIVGLFIQKQSEWLEQYDNENLLTVIALEVYTRKYILSKAMFLNKSVIRRGAEVW